MQSEALRNDSDHAERVAKERAPHAGIITLNSIIGDTMGKVGRNDPCPCGSGLKYKKCCENKKTTRPQFVPSWKILVEEVVLQDLLKNSKEFQAYFQLQRPKITCPILWVHDPSLPVGINFSCTRITNGQKYIRLRMVPPAMSDAVKVAHEIEHLILDGEGFPNISTTPMYETLSSALAAMLQDLVVDSRLVSFGFNMKSKYLDELADSTAQLEKIPNAPSDRLSKIVWIFNFASKVLDCGLFIGQSEEYSKFLGWFERRFPEISANGRDLCKIVSEHGYDSPEKMRRSFNTIIKKYRVDDILQVTP